MKLHLQTIAPISSAEIASSNVTTHQQALNLSLTMNFSGEQEIEVPGGGQLGLPGGQATFGVRRGELRLTLENCTLPLEKVALFKPFTVSIQIERQQTQSSEIQAGADLTARSVSAKSATGSAEKTNVEVFQVKKIGSEYDPGWVFEAYGDRNILEGTLRETLLGVLRIVKQPCEMAATFTVRGEDIRITWGKMGLANNIHRNKLAVIERAIALRYIKPMVESAPICQGRWRHG